MNTKALVASLFLVPSLFVASEALAKPDLTPEQLAKAKETASKLNPPVDFDVLMNEADRLGVECTGDLTRKIKIEGCRLKVDTAQSEERQAKLDKEIEASKERQNKLDEEHKVIEDRLKKKVNDLADKADKKLQQTK
jgi:hypothetical protein